MKEGSGRALRMPDVAARLGKSVRWLQDHLRAHPCGRFAGRTRLFTEADYRELEQSVLAVDEKRRNGFIYAAGFGDYVKIGWTRNVHRRIRDLQTPEPMKLLHWTVGYISDEKALHKQFAEFRLNGEWFRMCDPIRAWIAQSAPLRDAIIWSLEHEKWRANYPPS